MCKWRMWNFSWRDRGEKEEQKGKGKRWQDEKRENKEGK